MRTVTFSDGAVAEALNKNFICTWVNREPGFHNCDLTAERQISEYECFATKNFATFFTSPDLDVLHYASGFFRPAMFLEELEFVGKLRKAVLDKKGRYMEDVVPELRALHEEHAWRHEQEEGVVSNAAPAKEKKGEGRARGRRSHHMAGLRHLSQVHRDLAAKAAKVDGPVPLGAVFNRYLFGNPFEESKGEQRKKEFERSPGM